MLALVWSAILISGSSMVKSFLRLLEMKPSSMVHIKELEHSEKRTDFGSNTV